MLEKKNIGLLLQKLGFKEGKKGVFSRKYDFPDCEMSVDCTNERIIYPHAVSRGSNGKTDVTVGFSQPENFVVFECVDRLLKKGYRPEHIVLEKEYKLGHKFKGGRADISVYNPDGSLLFFIECKTAKEYSKFRKKLFEDGGQLFSYWKQNSEVKWLCLYASDLCDGRVEYVDTITTISCCDDANLEKAFKRDHTIKLYANANKVEDLYETWCETYIQQTAPDVIFGADSQAYNIGFRRLRKGDLRTFKDEDRIVNRFEEILRHNNVSDIENAFNKLIALFICKLVDEVFKSKDDELEFQYREGSDTYETLQDRLQRLHQEGMDKFMREKIFYVPDDYAEKLFSQYSKAKRSQAIADLKNTIRILKFYSNSDFAFKDVHNEELFYQNGKIVVEMVKLFQGFQTVYPAKDQFLGDMFERFLKKGVKQSVGQFFTATPLTRFVWDALPLELIIQRAKKFVHPKMIDYACGAAHFLMEGVLAVNAFFTRRGQGKAVEENRWVGNCVFGIEKDYRLARVSKVAMHMNGAGQSNIIFGDGLDNYPDKQIENGTFDILTANPPYSVDEFKAHLSLKNNKIALLDLVSNSGDEIQVPFIERITQLLKPNGIAAVILPASIATNENVKSAWGARSELLLNFRIRAIVQLQENAFGATNTPTQIYFLQKFDEPPKRRDMIRDSANAIISNENLEDWEDDEIFSQYIKKIGVTKSHYKLFLTRTKSVDYWADDEYFGRYVKVFLKRSEVINKASQAKFKALTKAERDKWYGDRFYEYVLGEVEFEKIQIFAAIYKQTVVVVKSPKKCKEEREFLGYTWSEQRGNEGLHVVTPGGKLYCDDDRECEGTIASVIRASFRDKYPKLREELETYVSRMQLVEMVDFSKPRFPKCIFISGVKNFRIESEFPLAHLGGDDGVCDIKIGGTPSRKKPEFFRGKNPWLSVGEMTGGVVTKTKEMLTDEGVKSSNAKLIRKGTTLISFKLSIGKTAIAGVDLYTNEAIAALCPKDKNKVRDKYLFYLFGSGAIDLASNVGNKSIGESLNSTFLKDEVLIPLPEIGKQDEIIEECEKCSAEGKKKRWNEGEKKDSLRAILLKHGVVKE